MLHGYGKQKFLRKSYSEDRQRALEDRTRYTEAELEDLEVTESGEGSGRTNSDTYTIYQFPYPIDSSIRSKKQIDLRSRPEIGG